MHRTLALPAVLLLAAACASAPRPTLAPLEEAAARVRGGSDDPRAHALAGWNALFDGGDADAAAAHADAAIAAAPDEPWAQLLRAELARRRLDPAAELEAWLAILEGAPDHPLAIVAAGRLDRFDDRSPELADRLRAAATALLADPRVVGEVRVRVRGALRRALRGAGAEGYARLVAESGIVTAGSVVGPLSAWHFLDAGKAFPPEARAPVAARYAGRELRPFSFPTGSISLRGEEPEGDVYYVLTVAEVAEGGLHALRLGTAASTTAAVAIDGVPLLERRALDGSAATLATRAIELERGAHLIALRVVRGRGPGSVQLALAPLDGGAAAVSFRAAMPGDRPGVPPRPVDDEGLRLATDPAALADALAGEGGVVGAWAAALHAQRTDVQAARALADRALAAAPRSTPLLLLRASLLVADGTLPGRIAAARAARDRDEALALDPGHARALLGRARMLAEGGRWEDALAAVEAAEAVAPESDAPALQRARIALARGFDGQALAIARRLAAEGDERCAGLRLVHELARRADAVQEEEEAARALLACGDGRPRLAALHAARGRRAEAIALARALLDEDPQDAGAAHRLADLLAADGDLEEAIAILERQEAHWPRNAWLPRRRAELLDRNGDRAGARTARERALSLHGGDLGLRRMLALEAGGEPMGDLRRDGMEVVRRFEAAPRRFDTPAAILLDHGAVEVHPDGSYVELVHTVTRVNDKRGVERFGEVHLPPDAAVLHLRTIKPDGRVLVPETIHGKDSISMPNLAVGDYVEVEYLQARGARGPALPGWTAAPFFFRSVDVPLLESTYVVRAHEAAGLELDVHNGMEGAPIEAAGPWRTVTLRRTDVPALVSEPLAPARREFLPWAQVGAGADEAGLFPYFADSLAPVAVPTLDVRRWAREATAGASGDRLAMVRALYERSMEAIEGNEGSFRSTAAAVLAAGRGNRALLLKAALEAIGVEARWAAVRTFDQDPDAYRFPEPNRWGHVVLVVRVVPDAPWIWLDPTTRWAPFGSLSPRARDVTAWILPASGAQAPVRTRTPDESGPRGREVELRLAVDEAGTIAGEGVERYLGWDGAVARSSLERIDDVELRREVESSLARAFPGVILASVEKHWTGAAMELRYAFEQPGAARDLGDGRVQLRLDAFQVDLGRRFLARATRETPLLIAAPERVRMEVELELPAGTAIERGVEAAREHGGFGDYRRDVGVEGSRVAIREALDLHRGRVPPEAYPAFADWVSAVDRAQQIELVYRR